MFTRIGELANALVQTQQSRRHRRNTTVEEEIGRAFCPSRMLPPTPSFGNNDNTNARPTASSCNTASSFRPSFPCSSSGNELEEAPHQEHHIPPYHQMATYSQLPSRPTPIYTVRRSYQPFRGGQSTSRKSKRRVSSASAPKNFGNIQGRLVYRLNFY